MLNRVVIMGRLGRDPDLKYTPAGVAVANFSLAVDRDFKDKNTGERETDWIDVVAWRQTAEFAAQYLKKGRTAVVDGRLQVRSYQAKDGSNRRVMEVVAEHVYFGDSKQDSSGGGYGGTSRGPCGYSGGGYSAPPASSGYGAPAENNQFTELSDDDGNCPF